MKSLPSGLAAHIATRDTTIATALKITRADGEVFGFTTHDTDDVVAGVPYRANPGLEVTDIALSADAAVGNLQLTTLHDGTVFTLAEVQNGVWSNASFLIFRYNWSNPADGIDILLAGTVGEFQLRQNTISAELRDLRQYLQQSVGDASSKTCRARLGDARCKKNLAAFTLTSLVSAVTSNRVFCSATRTEAAGWFDEGEIQFLGGANNGRHVKIKTFASGWFTLAMPVFAPISIGDAYQAIAGCRKRLEEDCRDKFNNVLNFVGEPHRKGVNDLIKPAKGVPV